ncbi:MAG TPA: ATP-dependent DNA helicase [Candidatus Saccharimonadales bacterium]|nr:ATP-dependent DNA helicase [Candidatus Saccharimonadales bacterium]
MEEFEEVYAGLNAAQKKAVDAVDGPVLVVAGPGTGKTQLLSARVAQILRTTDTLPQNILCLTFTESGAQNMRDRLTRFIGKNAYDVQIGTYHAFGGDLIRRYPEYFTETRLERPVDELGKRQILSGIIDKLSYRSPLKQTRHHLGDLMTTVSEVKRGLLTPESIRDIAASNLAVINEASKVISGVLADYVKRLPSKIAVAEPIFGEIYGDLAAISETATKYPPFENLAQLAADELEKALTAASEAGKTNPLTAWKNAWLVKNADNQYVLGGALEAARMAELANVLEAYEKALSERGLYDFDDMILRAITVLESNADLKYTLQEQYQYILLDEFQDTNAAQLRLVELLTDNPANEGRPNVLAVGDDDQAIYAFQGAQYSNMLDYFRLFKDVLVINLSENYRSTPGIIETARNVTAQITDSLSASFPELDKQLVAVSQSSPPSSQRRLGSSQKNTVEDTSPTLDSSLRWNDPGKNASGEIRRTEYTSEIAERAGVAAHIKQLLQDGVEPSEIAVLAPKHKYLEPLVPYLDGVPLRYERRENILQAPVIRQLLTMSKLVLALHNCRFTEADSYWPEVLSYPFWEFPVSTIWKLSWRATDTRKHWTELLLSDDQFRPVALLFLALAGQVETETLEVMLDRLTGTDEVATGEADLPFVRSKLRPALLEGGEAKLYQTVTELTVLRARLSEHQQQRGSALMLKDLLDFVAEYEAADEQMVNTSPYSEAADAVQLMTVFKAKGLEFAHVFIVSCHDDVWGSSSRGAGNKLTLPANLAPIRHAGATEDERLRIFFVALTRAKQGLYLTSHASTYAGKKPARLKYLAEAEQEDGTVTSQTLPAAHASVRQDTIDSPPLESLETNWHARHTTLTPRLSELLRERLERYRLSPTHLTKFLDLEHAGPQSFLLENLLRFPTAPSVDILFGNAMHETLEWLQQELNRTGKLPTAGQASARFSKLLEPEPLTSEQLAVQQQRGENALQGFLEAYTAFRPGNKPEYNFRHEGVVTDGVQMSGKIDLLEIDPETKRITVVDYKTGVLGADPAKRHRYELQLYCYKLLLQGSHTFRDYTVEQGRLVFVEPDADGKIQQVNITFKDDELARVRKLITAMWARVQALDLPDISQYPASLAGIKQFEQDFSAP